MNYIAELNYFYKGTFNYQLDSRFLEMKGFTFANKEDRYIIFVLFIMDTHLAIRVVSR